MKRLLNISIILIATLSISFSVLLFSACRSCSGEEESPTSSPVTITADSLSVLEYESLKLPIGDFDETSFRSENTNIAIVDEQGIVYGIKQGQTNVIATEGDNTYIYPIVVSRNSTCPYLSVNRTNLKIEKDECLSVSAELIYNGNALDVDIKVDCVSDAVSVEKNGNEFVFKGVSLTSDAIIADVYCEYFGRSFSQQLTLEVVEVVEIYLSDNNVSVYSFDNNGGFADKGFSRSYLLNCAVNGEETFDGVVWGSLDQSVATIENGLITGQSEGTTQVYASINVDGVEYRTYCNVTVSVPKIRLNETFELHKNSLDGDATIVLNGYELFGYSNNNVIVSLDNRLLNVNVLGNNTLSFDRDEIPAGEKEIVVYIKDYIKYVLTTKIYTKVIRTANELLNLTEYGEYTKSEYYGNTSFPDRWYTLDGYFALGNNITLGETVVSPFPDAALNIRIGNPAASNIANRYDGTIYGFIGTFDGCGYVIDGGVYGHGGLFGQIGKSGLVKNVAFTNGILKPTTAGGNAQVIAGTVSGNLENVLIDLKEVVRNAGTVSAVAYILSGGSLTNVVIYYPGDKTSKYCAPICGNLYSALHQANKSIFTNVIVVSNDTSSASDAIGIDNILGGADADIPKNAMKYADGTTCEQITWADVFTADDSIWVVTGEKAVFKKGQAN